MLKYLEKTYGDRATNGDRNKLVEIRKEAERLEALVMVKKASGK